MITPTFGSSLQSSDGEFRFALAGETGRNYQLQASTNLSTWSLVTNILMTNSTMSFVDPAAGRYPCRFYRLVLLH